MFPLVNLHEALRSSGKACIYLEDVAHNRSLVQNLLIGSKIDVLCHFIANGTEYADPFSRIEQNTYVFDEDRIVHYLIDVSLSEVAKNLLAGHRQNNFSALFKWLHYDDVNINYDDLPRLYAVSCVDVQRDIIKRYFHDIRLGRTSFDKKVLQRFKENTFEDFIRFRHCIESPEKPVNLSSALLVDCILTINKTQGKEIQTFNGTLDCAISLCDITDPNINMDLKTFLLLKTA